MRTGDRAGGNHDARFRMISVLDLEVGMRVVDTGLSWTEHPFLYSGEGPVTSAAQIEQLREQGYRDVFILDSRWQEPQLVKEPGGETLPDAAEGTGRRPPGPDDYAKALSLHDESFGVINSFILAAKLGKPMDRDAPVRLVEGVIDSVTSNPDALVSLIKLRFNDEYTYTHCINVSVLAVLFGHYMGMRKPELQTLGEAGLFHDLGKVRIPDGILDKPGRLTPGEFEVVKSHPEEGAAILEKQDMASSGVLSIIREHHEKFNGTGYPNALSGDRLGRLAQMIALADCYDAMTSKRPYRSAILPNTAMRIMFAMRNKDFSRELIEPFIKCLGIYPVGSPVRLRNGQVALVCGSNPRSPLFPTVKIILDAGMRPRPHKVLDLSSPEAKALGDGFSIEAPLDMSVLGKDPAGFLF